MPEDKDSTRFRIWTIVVSNPFEYFVMTLIALNTIILMAKVSGKNPAVLPFILRQFIYFFLFTSIYSITARIISMVKSCKF